MRAPCLVTTLLLFLFAPLSLWFYLSISLLFSLAHSSEWRWMCLQWHTHFLANKKKSRLAAFLQLHQHIIRLMGRSTPETSFKSSVEIIDLQPRSTYETWQPINLSQLPTDQCLRIIDQWVVFSTVKYTFYKYSKQTTWNFCFLRMKGVLKELSWVK